MHTGFRSRYSRITLAPALAVALAVGAHADQRVPEEQPQQATECLTALGRPFVQPAESLPRQLRVLVWNVQKTGHDDWKKDLSRLGQNHHLLLLQEALQGTAGALSPAQPLHAGFARGYSTDELVSGVLSLSATPATTQCDFTADEPWLGTPKAIKVTEYPLAGTTRRLLVVNLHAVNFTLGLKAFREQLALFANLLQHHDGPAIVAGDFNTWNDARREYLARFTSDLELREVAFQPDLRTRVFNNPLDGFFIRDLEATTAEVVAVDSSDHNPMLVTLELAI